MTRPFRGVEDAPRSRSLRTPYVGRPAHRPPCPFAIRRSLADCCRGRRPRRPAEGSRPLPTMQTGKGDTMARLRAGHARPLRDAVSGSGGSGALGGAQRAPPVCYANPLVRLFAPQGQTLLAPQFCCAQLWPHARNPATPEFKVEEGSAALRTDSNTASV